MKSNVLNALINWKTVVTAFTISALAVVGTDVWSIRMKAIESHAYMAEHRVQYEQEVKPLLEDIKQALEDINKTHKTMAGSAAIIQESADDSRAYVLINELGPANVHRSAKKVKVTNLNSDARPAFEFQVLGTYSKGSKEDHVIALSISAARLLQIPLGTKDCVVLIEPARNP